MAANRGLWQRGFVAKRPRDPNQLAKLIVDIATGEVEDTVSEAKRNPSKRCVGGLKGGKARAKTLSPAERQAIARTLRNHASDGRWYRRSRWSMEDIAILTDAAYAPKKRGPYKKVTEERCG